MYRAVEGFGLDPHSRCAYCGRAIVWRARKNGRGMYPFNLDNDRPHFCRRYVPPDDEDEEDGGGWKRTAKGNWSKNTPCCVAVVFRRQNGYYGFGLLFGADRAEWGSRLFRTVEDAMRAAEDRAQEYEFEDVEVEATRSE